MYQVDLENLNLKKSLSYIEQLGIKEFVHQWSNYPNELEETYREDNFAKIDFFDGGEYKLEDDLYILYFSLTFNNEVVVAAVRNDAEQFDISKVNDYDKNVEFYIVPFK